MKPFVLLLSAAFLSLTLPACHTASHAVTGATDEGAHAVQKTGHAVSHGVRKVEKHL